VAGKVHSGVVVAGVPAPMLARLESTLPRGPEWRYEPKLDGFRGLLWRSRTDAARVLSRNLKDLSVSATKSAYRSIDDGPGEMGVSVLTGIR
jgi:ATP-dependent DNA ligase